MSLSEPLCIFLTVWCSLSLFLPLSPPLSLGAVACYWILCIHFALSPLLILQQNSASSFRECRPDLQLRQVPLAEKNTIPKQRVLDSEPLVFICSGGCTIKPNQGAPPHRSRSLATPPQSPFQIRSCQLQILLPRPLEPLGLQACQSAPLPRTAPAAPSSLLSWEASCFVFAPEVPPTWILLATPFPGQVVDSGS